MNELAYYYLLLNGRFQHGVLIILHNYLCREHSTFLSSQLAKFKLEPKRSHMFHHSRMRAANNESGVSELHILGKRCRLLDSPLLVKSQGLFANLDPHRMNQHPCRLKPLILEQHLWPYRHKLLGDTEKSDISAIQSFQPRKAGPAPEMNSIPAIYKSYHIQTR